MGDPRRYAGEPAASADGRRDPPAGGYQLPRNGGKKGTTYEYEAVNLGDEAKTWKLERWNGGELAELTVPAHESLKGSVTL